MQRKTKGYNSSKKYITLLGVSRGELLASLVNRCRQIGHTCTYWCHFGDFGDANSPPSTLWSFREENCHFGRCRQIGHICKCGVTSVASVVQIYHDQLLSNNLLLLFWGSAVVERCLALPQVVFYLKIN